MFKFTGEKIDTEALKQSLEDAGAGALVTFEGIVRNRNQGQAVITLEYEAYETLGQSEAEVILLEAKNRYAILAAICVHRTGMLKVGEMAVFVAVSSAHRDAAFQACRYVIDEIKIRLPIWKKETYVSGSANWVNCRHGGHSDELGHLEKTGQLQPQLEAEHGH